MLSLLSLQEVAPYWLLLLPLLGQTFANILPASFLEPWPEWGAGGAFFGSGTGTSLGQPTYAPGEWGLAGGMAGTTGTDSGSGPYGPSFDFGPFLAPLMAGYEPPTDPITYASEALTEFIATPEEIVPAVVQPLGIDPGLLPTVDYGAISDAAAAAAATAVDATAATLDYIQGIPGAAGEAAGEFAEELGEGAGAGLEGLLGGVLDPVAAFPKDLLGGIPLWVPAIAVAYLALGRK